MPEHRIGKYRLAWPFVVAVVLIAIAGVFVRSLRHPVTPMSARSASPSSAEVTPSLALPSFEAAPAVDAALIPQLRMPFPAGVVVLCCQGNRSEAGLTHSLPQNLHALDFSNRVLVEVPVVAAAAGTVAYVIDDAGKDPDDGGGYGNQVRLQHEHGLFTLYAHLDRVSVHVGERIAAGQRLGTMGRTGLAGDRHLHLSLHHGAIDQEGVPDTLELPALIVSEATATPNFASLSSGALRCSKAANPWSGALYASENDGRALVSGVPPAELASQIAQATSLLERSVTRRSKLWDYSQHAGYLTRSQYRRFLEPLLLEAPDDPVVQYTWAVESELSAHKLQSASKHLAAAERSANDPALYEPWLHGWIEAQRGVISLMHARKNEAKRHFANAQELLPIPEIEEYSQKQWAELGGAEN